MAEKMIKEPMQILQQQMTTENNAAEGMRAIEKPIGKAQIEKANVILNKYKEGKANLEKRIIDNEQWYKLRHWECMRDKNQQVQPVSAWLFNCIANKHADAMDNYPRPNILPREEGDQAEATMLSSIIPVVLEQCDFEETYDKVWNYKLKNGTGVYGVFWDKDKLGGLGDVSVKKVDLINLFWESGITDIQKSKNLFYVELVDNDLLKGMYPELGENLVSSSIDISKYIYDDSVDTSEKSVVVDWYYKKNQNGRTVLHFCKYVGNEVLFATENNPEYRERGLYDHGKYPFVFDVLFPVEGTPTGFGYIDVGKDTQSYIDRGNAAIMQNMLSNARPRYFIRSDGSVNEEEFADMTKDFIHVDGSLGQDSVMPVTGKPLNGIYVSVVKDKVDELKETTGNRDVSTGGTSGATAASAIAAMQEAGSKLSRDSIKASYRTFKSICDFIIELIRQFYDMPRCFRIIGEKGKAKYISYDNRGIMPQAQGAVFGEDMGYRLPLFDIQVTAEKSSPYSRMAQNEMALQFFSAGFFNPQAADQALMCLDMMDFDGKEEIMEKIAQSGTMYRQMMAMQQQLLQLGAIVDSMKGTDEVTQGLLNQYAPSQEQSPSGEIPRRKSGAGKESSVTSGAREKVAVAASPR